MWYLFYHNKKKWGKKVKCKSLGHRVKWLSEMPWVNTAWQRVMLVLILISSKADPETRIWMRQLTWDALGIPVGEPEQIQGGEGGPQRMSGQLSRWVTGASSQGRLWTMTQNMFSTNIQLEKGGSWGIDVATPKSHWWSATWAVNFWALHTCLSLWQLHLGEEGHDPRH